MPFINVLIYYGIQFAWNKNKQYRVHVRGGGRTKALLLENSFFEALKIFWQ